MKDILVFFVKLRKNKTVYKLRPNDFGKGKVYQET